MKLPEHVENLHCYLYKDQAAETHQHAFVEYHWIQFVCSDILIWLDVQLQEGDIEKTLVNIKKMLETDKERSRGNHCWSCVQPHVEEKELEYLQRHTCKYE